MIWMFKIMNGLVRVDASKLFVQARLSHTRGHPQKVFKKHAVKLARKNSFSQRCVNDWNSLPNFVVEAPSLDAFKIGWTIFGKIFTTIMMVKTKEN